MIRFLLDRPIAVFMTFMAFFLLGIITYFKIPVSLLPNIAIPEITVQVSGENLSARELENTVVAPIRLQLLQVSKLRDIQSESRDGNAVLRLNFEYGVNTDLAFIEVNEKVDATMNTLPRSIERPRIVKASASDIPVFFLNLTLKSDQPFKETNEQGFLDLSEVAQSGIKKRIEQLPQVAMVDVTGILDKQILVIPNSNALEISGITLSDISSILKNNNIEPGGMTVKDGHYEYSINFSSVVRTLTDVQNIYLKKNGRIFQLKDIADIRQISKQTQGISLYKGKRAITLGIIKQAEENMSSLQNELSHTIQMLQATYPEVEFSKSQNQTELLEYTITNLKQNLILAFVFVCLVSAFFMGDVKSPLIIGISMFVSLIVCLLFFYVFKISLNIVSLTGLVLALGMMIDNSIIVTDNIGQYRRKGIGVNESCIRGTNEVIAPMLSSSFTTISVFAPLIFMSGISGAIFFDQAFSVTVGLLVSYLTGIILLPVLYKSIYSIKSPLLFSRFRFWKCNVKDSRVNSESVLETIYHRITNWVFANKVITIMGVFLIFPLCIVLFFLIRKEKLPEISQRELVVNVEWNENIHLHENQMRSTSFLQYIEKSVRESSALIGRQQFLINNKREQTFSESEFYFRITDAEDIYKLKIEIDNYLRHHYPNSIVTYSPAGTIFERIFVTAEPDLRLEYYPRKEKGKIHTDSVKAILSKITQITGYYAKSISFQKQLDLVINKEKLMLYNISYDNVYQALKSGFKKEEITTLRSYQQYLPILMGKEEDNEINQIINNTLIYEPMPNGGKGRKIPLNEFISVIPTDGMKSIIAGRNGEYIPFDFHDVSNPEMTLTQLKNDLASNNELDVNISGSFFSNKKMLNEMIVILVISILLMYFILAAQFESFVQPLIVLLEIPIAIAAALGLLILMGHSLNLMSSIGIVVTCGIIINDSILKLDIMNQLRKQGVDLIEAIHEAGRRRLNAILMTCLTPIVCMMPVLFSQDIGSELEKPLAIATIAGMVIGTPISLFIVPLIYWYIYRQREIMQ